MGLDSFSLGDTSNTSEPPYHLHHKMRLVSCYLTCISCSLRLNFINIAFSTQLVLLSYQDSVVKKNKTKNREQKQHIAQRWRKLNNFDFNFIPNTNIIASFNFSCSVLTYIVYIKCPCIIKISEACLGVLILWLAEMQKLIENISCVLNTNFPACFNVFVINP